MSVALGATSSWADKANGRCTALANEVEDHVALLHQLKTVVADLLADRDLSVVVPNRFQGRFAPYRNEQPLRSPVLSVSKQPWLCFLPTTTSAMSTVRCE